MGPLVLKAVTNASLHHDIAEVSLRAVEAGAPLVAPVRSVDGAFVVDGWAATEVVAHTGHEWEHADRDWGSVFDAARRLHAGLRDVAVPESFRVFRSRSRWARADDAVWSGDLPELATGFDEAARRLRSRLQPVDHDVQIVHGDICGNVLRRTDGSLLIIDFSPYLRPVGYAHAILAVDAMLWYGASMAVTDLVGAADRRQMLLRAALFRLVCDGIFYREHPLSRSAAILASYDRVFSAIGGVDTPSR